MEIELVGSKKKKLELSEAIFACRYNEAVVHQVVNAYLAGGRSGTKAQKTRSDVSGGGTKPWRQKGAGRARAGTIRSPLWRKGGVVFAARPRNYEQKVNKKVYKLALRTILSELVRSDRLVVVEEFNVDSPKTKGLLEKLHKMNVGNDVLIINEAVDENLYLAARNLRAVEVRDVLAIDPVALVGFEKVVLTAPAVKQLEELLK